MDRTPFAGLTIVAPDESIYEDGASFLSRNPQLTDYLLRLGAKTHRHNGLPGLANPGQAPAVAVVEGGFLPPEVTLNVGYTLVDADGGETMVSPLTTVTTPAAMAPPSAAPGIALASGGVLPIGAYYYAVTLTDGRGGETTLGPAVTVSLTGAQKITLTGLRALRGASGQSLVVYKSTGGAFYRVVETIADTWTDDGTPCADCTIEPPAVNSTFTEWALDISVPSGAAQGATQVRIYASTEPELASPALVATLASGALTTEMLSTQYAVGSPPPVSMSKGGANLIDPDTELIDWRWKRPVTSHALLPAGAPGDVRLVINPTPEIYAVGSGSAAGPADWVPIEMFGPQGPKGDKGVQGDPGPILHPKGEYALASGYAAFDQISFNGASYWTASAVAPGLYPPQAPWLLLADKGDRGPQGGPGMRFVGQYDPIVTYPLDSVVTDNEILYVAAGSAVPAGTTPTGSGGVMYRGFPAVPLVEGAPLDGTVDGSTRVPSQFSGSVGNHPGVIGYFDVVTAGTVTIAATLPAQHATWFAHLAAFPPDIGDQSPLAASFKDMATTPQITFNVSAGRYYVYLYADTNTSFGAFRLTLTGTAEFATDYHGYWVRVAGWPVVADDGGTYPTRGELHFTGAGVAISDDPADDSLTISIPGRHTIIDEATTLPARSKLKFAGAGVTASDDPGNGQTVVTISGGGGGGGGAGAEARGSAGVVTASLASGASEQGSVAMGVSSHILRVSADKACRVRLYTQATKRVADSSRSIGVDPVGDHGLVLEVVLTAGVSSLDLAPQVIASNMDATPSDAIYYNVTNMGAAGAVSVTFIRQRLEF